MDRQTKIKYSLKQRVDSNAAFDMEQMQKSLDNTVNSQPRKSGGSSASNQQPRSKNHRADNGSSNLEVADQDSVQVMSNTTTPAKNGSNNKSEKKVISMTTVVKFPRADQVHRLLIFKIRLNILIGLLKLLHKTEKSLSSMG